MRIFFLALACASVLVSPTAAVAHGSERHYGNPFGEEKSAGVPKPAFSIMLVENSLKAIRRTLRGEAEESVEERLALVRRFTKALLVSTASEAPSEFATFQNALESHSPALLAPSGRQSPDEEAVRAVDALSSTFAACKRRFAAQNHDG